MTMPTIISVRCPDGELATIIPGEGCRSNMIVGRGVRYLSWLIKEGFVDLSDGTLDDILMPQVIRPEDYE
jgi:hypothetical protein